VSQQSRFTKEQQRKIIRFYNLLASGREFYYHPDSDVLYADLNYNLLEGHVGLALLEELGKKIYEPAIKIWQQEYRSKTSKVSAIAKLLKGTTVLELMDAGKRATDRMKVAKYIVDELKILKPTQLKIWTDTPFQVANICVRKKIDPLYNSDGNIRDIPIYATEMEHQDGILTGEINFIPDEYFRHNISHLETLRYLDKHKEKIY